MIRVNVFYPRKDGAGFDWAYYLGTHIPLVRRKLGAALLNIAVEQGIAGIPAESPAAFVALAQMSFESVPAFQAAFTPHSAEIMGDIPNYTTIQPIIQISEVRL